MSGTVRATTIDASVPVQTEGLQLHELGDTPLCNDVRYIREARDAFVTTEALRTLPRLDPPALDPREQTVPGVSLAEQKDNVHSLLATVGYMVNAVRSPEALAFVKERGLALQTDGDTVFAPKLTAFLGNEASCVVEASAEFILLKCGELLGSGDTGKDIDLLSEQLEGLKKEKKELLAQLNARAAEITGLLRLAAESAIAARKAAEKAEGGFFGTLLKVVLAPALAPVAIYLAGALLYEKAAKTVGIDVSFYTKAVTFFFMTYATILGGKDAAKDYCDALNDVDSEVSDRAPLQEKSDSLEVGQEAFTDAMKQTWFQVVLIIAAVAMAIVLAVFTAGASAKTALLAVSSILGTLQGLDRIEKSFAIKELAACQADVDRIRIQMAAVELQVKELMQEIAKKKNNEEELKEDIADRQETAARIMENINKGAESLAQFFSSQQVLG